MSRDRVRQVVYIEPDLETRELVSAVLTQDLAVPVSLQTIASARLARKALLGSSMRPDLIISNLRDGGMTLLLEVKKDARLKDVPYIVMSATDSQEAIQTVKKNGAEFMPKPFDLNKMIDGVNNYLQGPHNG